MEKIPQNQEKEGIEKEYSRLIDTYQSLSKELKALNNKKATGVVDDELLTSTKVIDKERHDLHLKLVELGQQLGKDKPDVLVDIIRKQRTLEEFGLPEFSILRGDDIVETGYWHNPYYFNVDSGVGLPADHTPNLEEWEFYEDFAEEEQKKVLSDDQIMIVFAIVSIENYGSDELDPADYDERTARAKALAEEVGGEVFEERDTGYHEADAKILGVIVPKKDLEKIASVIRNNPKKFRLGEEFYDKTLSLDDTQLLKRANKAMVKVGGFDDYISELPDPILGTEVLKNKRIVMVDDDEHVFQAFIPPLMVATNGRADVLGHFGQKLDDLVDEILGLNPEVILLDKNLSVGIDGVEVAKKLIQNGFSGEKIVGFSSDARVSKAFKDIGTMGVVIKDIKSPQSSIKKLAEILR